MILSPPFLPDTADHTEDAWLDLAMAQPDSILLGTRTLEGSFPLSKGFCWHNGLHIQSSQPNRVYLPVRAIADGVVVFVRPPTPPNIDTKHPLNYNPFDHGPPTAAWTSDGFIVIRHTTEIGAAGTVPTAVTYFSACMHMDSIARNPRTSAPWKAGDAVYRKDELGHPGQIYGHTGQIHFEISCDQASLNRLTTRNADWVDPFEPHVPTANGRTDSVFGSLYIYLSASTPTSAARPDTNLRRPARLQGGQSVASSGQEPNTLGQAHWVQITYDKGASTLRSYNLSGAPIGTSRTEPDFEYNLYNEATTRHDSLNAENRLLSSPSGWYELLRFGRNLGPDPLMEHAAHWREIPTAEGTIWADLNASGTFKFSDADFLSVMGWNCFDDDPAPNDQRCDSLRMKTRIRDPDPANETRMEREQLALRLGVPAIRAGLRRTICNFPNEWIRETVAARYSWLQTGDFSAGDDDAEAANKWSRFVNHAEALTIPRASLPEDYLAANWRFHPREFVGVMRKCGWLSTNEFAQCFPRKQLHLRGQAFHEVTQNWNDSIRTASRWITPFNKTNRKYGISASKQRLVHYFSHVIPETGFLRFVKESDNRAQTYLRSQRYWPYYGRGLIQLTWLENYQAYGAFRKIHKTLTSGQFADLGWNPDSVIALDNTNFDADNCSDSAGLFVTRYPGMVEQMDAGITQEDAINVSRCVNGNVSIQNLNGLDVRLQSILFLRDALLDGAAEALDEALSFSWRRNSNQEPGGKLNSQGLPSKKYFLKDSPWLINVPLQKQRP